MRRLAVLAFVAAIGLLPSAAWADHVPPAAGVFPFRLDAPTTTVEEGPIRFVANAQAGRAFSGALGELPPFTRDGRRYMIAGSSIYGFSVVDVTDPLEPTVVSEYASAFGCPTSGLQAQLTGEPDPLAYGGWENDVTFAPDGRWVVLGMDAAGRCHDPAAGGIEIVDLSDVRNPRTLHLVRNVGYSHSITLDPARPWLAYISTSDGNDNLEIVDFHACIGKDPAVCKPTVARTVFDPAYMPGLADPKTKEDRAGDGCHDVRFRGDRVYCAAVGSTMILDVSRAVRADGTLSGTHITEGTNACPVVDADALYAPGVKVTDCLGWTKDAFKERKAKATDVRLLSVITHDGDKPADQDIQIAHQASAIGDGTIMIITDERGGGLGADECPGGGIWFYDIRNERKPVLMRQPDGSLAVFRTKYNIPSIAGTNPNCTVHYGREFADENLLTFGWYTNGTRMFRYFPDFSKSPAQVRFEEVAAIAPIGSTFDAMALVRNPENPAEVLAYAADVARGIDVFAIRTPRLTRAQAFKGLTKRPIRRTVVRGTKTTRGLAGTGLADGEDAGVALLILAFALHVVRRRTAY